MTDYDPFKIDTPYFSGVDGGASLRAASLKCVVCGSAKVVYAIDVTGHGYQQGAYCYNCLLRKILLTGYCPTPIGTELLDKLKHDSGRFTILRL